MGKPAGSVCKHKIPYFELLQALLIHIYLPYSLLLLTDANVAALSRADNPVKDRFASNLHPTMHNVLLYFPGTLCAQMCAHRHNARLGNPVGLLGVSVMFVGRLMDKITIVLKQYINDNTSVWVWFYT